jgi:glycosyltransferase involved in cell wall biosynthesis
VELKIYGNVQSFPKYSKRLVNLIGDDDRIKFSGVFVPEEMNRIYQDIDIVVLPSIWYENSPNVILEAFERKTPVIASNLGGMAELVIHGKDGLLFESSNPFDLASKISLLIEKKNLIEDLSRGIEPVKSLTREVDELEEYYSRVLAEKQKRKG